MMEPQMSPAGWECIACAGCAGCILCGGGALAIGGLALSSVNFF